MSCPDVNILSLLNELYKQGDKATAKTISLLLDKFNKKKLRKSELMSTIKTHVNMKTITNVLLKLDPDIVSKVAKHSMIKAMSMNDVNYLRKQIEVAQKTNVSKADVDEALCRLNVLLKRERLGLHTIEYPRDFCCPITISKMKDPVVASDGHSYERNAIEAVIKGSGRSPVTRELLQKFVFPNHALAKRIDSYYDDMEICAETALKTVRSM